MPLGRYCLIKPLVFFIGATFPGVMRCRKIKPGSRYFFNLFGLVKLSSIHSSDRFEFLWVSHHQAVGPLFNAAVVRFGNLPIKVKPVLRSTSVTIQAFDPLPITVSISQCPLCWRFATLLGARRYVAYPASRPRLS